MQKQGVHVQTFQIPGAHCIDACRAINLQTNRFSSCISRHVISRILTIAQLTTLNTTCRGWAWLGSSP